MNRRQFLKTSALALLASNESFAQENSKPDIYLTFDDGPSKYMNSMVDSLGNQKAIFYVNGEHATSETGKSRLRNTLENGHILGNHSQNHPDFRTLSLESAKNQIIKTEILINEAYMETGIARTHQLFRFPYGAVKTNLLPWLKEEGFSSIKKDDVWDFWDTDSQDWMNHSTKSYKSQTQIEDNCLRAKQEDIVLCHEKSITLNHLIPLFLENYNLILPA